MQSVNPVNGAVLGRFDTWEWPRVDKALGLAASAVPEWAQTPLPDRAERLRRAAQILRQRRD